MSRLYPCVYCTEDGYCKKFSDEEVVSWCVQGPCQYEKPSNADRIRAMTDEELAQHLCFWDNSALHASSERWLEWLKEEVDNEDD